jgi:hypothetical protein
MYYDEEVDIDAEFPTDEKLPSTSDGVAKFEDPEKHTGVVYLSTVPQGFSAMKIREVFSNFGEVGRIFLQVCFGFHLI